MPAVGERNVRAGTTEIASDAAGTTSRINRGQMPDLENSVNDGSDFYFVEAADPDDAVHKILEIVHSRIPARFGFDPIRDVQVLCPMNRGRLGARSLNLDLQLTLNGDESKPTVARFGWSFRVGDKVMQTANDYDKDVFNGDIGFVRDVDVDAQEVVVEFDGRPVTRLRRTRRALTRLCNHDP